MQYATIMPQHAIDKLRTIALDVNLFRECKYFIRSKRYVSPNLHSPMKMLPTKMQMQNPTTHMPPYEDANATFHDANVPCRDANATFHDKNVHCRDANAKRIHDDANSHILNMMQIPLDADATSIFRSKCLLAKM